MVLDSLLAEFRHWGLDAVWVRCRSTELFPLSVWEFRPLAGSCTFRHHFSKTFDGTRRLGLSAFVEVSPHAGQCSVLRSPALLTPSPLDNKQPFNPTQRTGSQRWKLKVKDLDVVNRERFGLFGLAVLGVNTQNFARFWKNSSRFGIFFAIFLPLGGIFLPTTGLPGVFADEGCRPFRRLHAVLRRLQSVGRIAPARHVPAGAEASQTAGRGKRTVVESRTASASCGERHCSPWGAGVSVMPWRSAVWGRCRRAKLIMLEHYITGARGRVMHATNYSLTCILPRDFKGLLVLFVFISWLVCFMP